MSVRFLDRFTSADASVEYEWPRNLYEMEVTQGLRVPRAAAIGADYAVRLIGERPGLKSEGRARVRFVLADGYDGLDADAERDVMLTKLHAIGLGKLYTSDNRWTWASLAEMPSISFGYSRPGIVPVTLGFDLWSNWFGAQHDVTETVTSDGQEWQLTNDGLLAAVQLQITLIPNTTGGFDGPKITNLTNGYECESSRASASTDDRLRLDTQMRSTGPAILFSDDQGASYADDFANYVLPPDSQKVLTFQLEPGANTIRLNSGGTPNVGVRFVYWDAWP